MSPSVIRLLPDPSHGAKGGKDGGGGVPGETVGEAVGDALGEPLGDTLGDALGDAVGDTVQSIAQVEYSPGHAVLAESDSWIARLLQGLSEVAFWNMLAIEVTLLTSKLSGWSKLVAESNV